MKTAVPINESLFEKQKRESEEWLEEMANKGKPAPSFLWVALRAFKSTDARLQELILTDEQVKQVAKEIFIDIDNTMEQEDLRLCWVDFYIGFNEAVKWARNKLTGK